MGMKVYKSFDEIEYDKNTVLTVGSFDGIHLGHRKILDRLLEIARDQKLRPVVLTLDPHPQIILQKKNRNRLFLLTVISERIKLLRNYGIEHVLVIPFSYEFSQTSPDEFVRSYLSEKVGMKRMLIGYDHMFGKNREGNTDLLDKLGDELDFDIETIGPMHDNDEIISSTLIRKALADNDLDLANDMLGYPYMVDGQVTKGDGRGRQLGYPTANVQVLHPNKLMPQNGVYLVKAQINGGSYFGMANLGTRPTFTDDKMPTLEIHFFDFDKDIYNRTISVSFIKHLRNEQKFSGVEEFLEQLKIDNDNCKKWIKKLEIL